MCVCLFWREEDGFYLHNNTLHSLWWHPAPPSPPPPSLPPFQPPSLSVSVSEFLTEDLQNNGVTSCSRSLCLQQSFQPSVHQAGTHLIWDLQVTVKFPLFFFFFFLTHSTRTSFLCFLRHVFLRRLTFSVFRCLYEGFNRPTVFFPT